MATFNVCLILDYKLFFHFLFKVKIYLYRFNIILYKFINKFIIYHINIYNLLIIYSLLLQISTKLS